MSESLFRVHIYVDSKQVYALRAYCAEEGLKPDLSYTESGECCQLTFFTWHQGTCQSAYNLGHEICADLFSLDLRVERFRVAAAVSSPEVPVDPWEGGDRRNYFEFRFTIVATLGEAEIFADKHGLAVSFSAFNTVVKPVLTLRIKPSYGSTSAEQFCDVVCALLRGEGIKLWSVHKEYIVYDDAPDNDQGWIVGPWHRKNPLYG